MVKNSEREPGAKGGHFQALSSVSLKMGTSFLSLSKLEDKGNRKGKWGACLTNACNSCPDDFVKLPNPESGPASIRA